jgi:hypothetical protein
MERPIYPKPTDSLSNAYDSLPSLDNVILQPLNEADKIDSNMHFILNNISDIFHEIRNNLHNYLTRESFTQKIFITNSFCIYEKECCSYSLQLSISMIYAMDNLGGVQVSIRKLSKDNKPIAPLFKFTNYTVDNFHDDRDIPEDDNGITSGTDDTPRCYASQIYYTYSYDVQIFPLCTALPEIGFINDHIKYVFIDNLIAYIIRILQVQPMLSSFTIEQYCIYRNY